MHPTLKVSEVALGETPWAPMCRHSDAAFSDSGLWSEGFGPDYADDDDDDGGDEG